MLAAFFSSTIISIILGTILGLTGVVLVGILGFCEIEQVCTQSFLDTSVDVLYLVFIIFITIVFFGSMYAVFSLARSYKEKDQKTWDKFTFGIISVVIFFLMIAYIASKVGIIQNF